MERPSRKTVAEDALIEAAERIFGRDGIEGASLRAIAQEAGSANSYAVQYHFGDRDGLVRAIFDRRLTGVEVRRQALREVLPDAPSMRDLLDLIYRPLFEQRDGNGRHSYAGFLLGLHRSEGLGRRRAVDDQAAVAAWAVIGLRRALPAMDAGLFAFRLDAVSAVILDALARPGGGEAGAPEPLFARLLDLGEAMLRAPSSP